VSSSRGAAAAAPPQWTDFTALPWYVYLLFGPLLLMLLVGIAVGVYVLIKGGAASGYWRDAGKVLPLLNLLVLLIAYAFYSTDQSRSLGEALQDMVSAELAEFLPSAVATEAILLCLFWLLFATIMRLPRRLVLAPIQALLNLVAFLVLCVLFTVSWINLITVTGESDVVGIVAGMVLVWLALGVLSTLDESNPFTVTAMRGGVARRSADDDRQDRPRPPLPLPPRPRVSLRTVLNRTVSNAVGSLVLAFLITFLAGGFHSRPTVDEVVQVELIVFAVIFVIWCLMLRTITYDMPHVPVSMAGFTNLGLALSATMIAATGVAASPVVLGPVPPLLIAVLPGVITAVAVFLVDVRPHRRSARAFGICLAVSMVAGVLGPAIKPVVSALTDAAFTALSSS
jgi:hypothetical protein